MTIKQDTHSNRIWQDGKRVDDYSRDNLDPANLTNPTYYPPIDYDGEPVFETCDHCGARHIYGVAFEDIRNGRQVCIGHICSTLIEGIDSRHGYELGRLKRAWANKRQAEKDAAEAAERSKVFAADHPELAEYLADIRNLGHRNDFIRDIARKQLKYGNLSPAQIEAADKFREADSKRQAEAEAEPQPTTPLAEGRLELSGTILGTKWQDGPYGSQCKMLVKLDDHNKVWGTVPESLWGNLTADELKGQAITFTATVQRSQDDEHFGFFKRPTKGKVV